VEPVTTIILILAAVLIVIVGWIVTR